VAFNQDINAIVIRNDTAVPEYVFQVLKSMQGTIVAVGIKRGGTVQSLQSRFLHELQIPLPSLDIQNRIVGSIEAERVLVESNRKLIEVFKGKIKAKLDEVWGRGEEVDGENDAEVVQEGTQDMGDSLV
jgi:restriction endonuclease S subunit